MATHLTAVTQLVHRAARRYESGQWVDLEAGTAKLFASEAVTTIALTAVRIHRGYGYSTEFDVERCFRGAPLMIVGEGTNEIQRNIIARNSSDERRKLTGRDRGQHHPRLRLLFS
jgi:alkylation response protein AidB-like acyl-CoA dehydrogenase